MIYEGLDPQAPIRQGDIFHDVPLVELPCLTAIPLVREESIEQASWRELQDEGSDRVSCVATIRRVAGIVLTQDCDAARAPEMCLCEIRPFLDVEPGSETAQRPKSFVSFVLRQARINQKWFYLPPDPAFGFPNRMGVDFFSIFRLPSEDLREMRTTHRLGCLSKVAREHYRERAAEFFRRYPYDEWYPLNQEEFAAYQAAHPLEPVEPFPWQQRGREA